MSEAAAVKVFTDAGGTWLTDAEGWTRRERDGHPTYVVCNCCDAYVDRTKGGLCPECAADMDAP